METGSSTRIVFRDSKDALMVACGTLQPILNTRAQFTIVWSRILLARRHSSQDSGSVYILRFTTDVPGVKPNLNIAYLSESLQLPPVMDPSRYAAQFPVMHDSHFCHDCCFPCPVASYNQSSCLTFLSNNVQTILYYFW